MMNNNNIIYGGNYNINKIFEPTIVEIENHKTKLEEEMAHPSNH